MRKEEGCVEVFESLREGGDVGGPGVGGIVGGASQDVGGVFRESASGALIV